MMVEARIKQAKGAPMADNSVAYVAVYDDVPRPWPTSTRSGSCTTKT